MSAPTQLRLVPSHEPIPTPACGLEKLIDERYALTRWKELIAQDICRVEAEIIMALGEYGLNHAYGTVGIGYARVKTWPTLEDSPFTLRQIGTVIKG
jgi:hypothetical protein